LFSIKTSAVICNPIPDGIDPAIKQAVKSAVSVVLLYKESGATISNAGGSGFIINKSGYILTAFHNLKRRSDISILKEAYYQITLFDCREYMATFIWGGDEAIFAPDMALLKLENPPEDIIPANIEMVRAVNSGDDVFAIGSPEWSNNKVTSGKVTDTDVIFPSHELMPYIHSTAHVTYGSSGGMLVNNLGSTVGMTTGCSTKILNVEPVCEGGGYFTPISLIMKWVESLKLPNA